LLVMAKGIPSCVSIVPISVPEASDSTTIVLLKLGAIRTRVVHMALFNYVKAFSSLVFK
jgi:hypothetical protein